MPSERLQKILAHAGVASRRAAERLISEGHVRVNGRIVTELGSKADPHKDRVELDGKRLVAEHPVYYLLHKPREVVTTLSDPEHRESVADLTKRIPERVFPVGRLDYHTSGALLMTNDGEMAQALLHPKKLVPKVYIAKVRGSVANAHLQQLRLGVSLDDETKTRPADVFIANEEGGNMWLQITITEGKNRQIHRMLEAVGYRVTRLFRLSFAGLSADGLKTGEFRPLTDGELSKLKRDYLNPSKKDKADTKRDARRARMAGDVAAPPEWEPARSVPRSLRDRVDDAPRGRRQAGPSRSGQDAAVGGKVQRGGAALGARKQRTGPAPGPRMRKNGRRFDGEIEQTGSGTGTGTESTFGGKGRRTAAAFAAKTRGGRVGVKIEGTGPSAGAKTRRGRAIGGRKAPQKAPRFKSS